MDGLREYRTQSSKTEIKKYYMILLICGILKIILRNEYVYKTVVDPQTQKTNLWLPQGKEKGRRDKLGEWY